MRFLVWVCRVILTVVIAAFVTTVFYLTHSVSMPEGAKAALNWVTVAGTALVGLSWPLMRRYWQALLLLVGLGVARALFGVHPALPSQETQLLTNFQSDFLWISIGVAFVALVGTIAARAIMSDRRMRAMRQAASSATTGEYLAAGALHRKSQGLTTSLRCQSRRVLTRWHRLRSWKNQNRKRQKPRSRKNRLTSLTPRRSSERGAACLLE